MAHANDCASYSNSERDCTCGAFYVPDDEQLTRALAVVEAAIELGARYGECVLCDGGIPAHHGQDHEEPHDADCPLVANGFITTDGRRVG